MFDIELNGQWRNIFGILIQVNKDTSILLDFLHLRIICGILKQMNKEI